MATWRNHFSIFACGERKHVLEIGVVFTWCQRFEVHVVPAATLHSLIWPPPLLLHYCWWQSSARLDDNIGHLLMSLLLLYCTPTGLLSMLRLDRKQPTYLHSQRLFKHIHVCRPNFIIVITEVRKSCIFRKLVQIWQPKVLTHGKK